MLSPPPKGGLRLYPTQSSVASHAPKPLGSVETGKQADLVVLGRTLNFEPWLDPVNALVLAESGESVERVFIEGEEVVREGRALGLERAGRAGRRELLETVEKTARRLRENLPGALAEAEEMRPHLHALSRKYAALPLEHA